MIKYRKIIPIFLTLIILALCTGCRAEEGNIILAENAPQSLTEAMEYYGECRLGVQTGSSTVSTAEEYFPNAQISYFTTGSDLKSALLNNKIDAFIYDAPAAKIMYKEDPSFKIYEGNIYSEYFAFAFDKNTGKELCEKMNVFLKEISANGVKEELEEKWINADDSTSIAIDINSLPSTNGTLSVVTELAFPPFEYFQGSDEIAGMEMEMLALFAQEYGYALNIENVDFSTVILSLTTGKADMIASALAITEERQESVLFSDPFYESGPVLCISNVSSSGESSKIIESFNKTFIKQDRWKLFTNGMLVTLLISLFSIVAGTILGFAIFTVLRKGGKVTSFVISLISKIILGMPVVVFLMLMYYLVFGKSRMDAIWISAISFSVIFAIEVSAILCDGNKVIDNGQFEAAYMLGYKERSAFYKIILPQIIINSISSYSSAIVSLVLSTAVVGYIAVEDITKVGDIVRSRTYEAFFPLIVTAAAYFLISWIVTIPVRKIKKKFDPKTRKINIKEDCTND